MTESTHLDAAALAARIAALEQRAEQQCLMLEDVHRWLQHAEGFFRVLGLIGRVVQWTAGIVAAVVAAWVAWTHKRGGE